MTSYTPIVLIGSVKQGTNYLVSSCGYPNDEATKRVALDLIGFFVEDYDDDNQREPSNPLPKLTNCANTQGVIIVADRLYPKDIEVFIDTDGNPWGCVSDFS